MPEGASGRPARAVAAADQPRDPDPPRPRPRSTGSPTPTWRGRNASGSWPRSSPRSSRAATWRATTSPASTCRSCGPSSCGRGGVRGFGQAPGRRAADLLFAGAPPPGGRRPLLLPERARGSPRRARRRRDDAARARGPARALRRAAAVGRALHDLFCAGIDQDLDPEGRIRLVNGEPTINFGKNRGRALRDMGREEPGFLRWILKGDFSEPVKTIARKYLPEGQ